MRASLVFAVSLLVLVAASGCAPGGDDEEPDQQSEDLRAQGFDRHRLISDEVFTDSDAMTADEIQAFLENTPYGTTSGLASYEYDGMTAAEGIARAAQEHGINPLVILVRAQMESSLIFKSNPSRASMNAAFGCGCPDGGSCDPAHKGFGKQAKCLASWMRGYLDDLEQNGETVAGWQVGVAKKTLDPKWVTPKNKATAALYTYTPWVGTSGFGNLSHYLIWKKFAKHVGYFPDSDNGCEPVTYPSGLATVTYPAEALTSAYQAVLGMSSDEAPTCFVDPNHLEDPLSGQVIGSNAKVANNFTMSEFVVGESGTGAALVAPELVERLQWLRESLGTSVTVVDGYRSPERHVAECEECTNCFTSCSMTRPMTLGQGAIISAGVADDTLLQTAQQAGFSTCRLDNGELYVDVSATGGGC